MTQHDYMKRAAYIAAFTAIFQLSACGGGGGGSSASSTPAPTLSAAQQNYENVVLSGNGGAHYVLGALSFTTNNSGGFTINAGSYFYTQDASLSASPAVAGTQRLTTGTSMLSASLAVPTVSPQRYVVNGAIVAGTIPATVQISYSGANVVETYLASDGQTPVETFQGTSYTSVPLAGAIANSPAELLTDTALSVITNTINGQSLYNKQSTWQPNAAYIKETRNYVGDTAFTGDCTAPATTGTSVTPCNSTASTLEGFFPFAMDNKTYNLTDGQIVTLAGARAWVSNAALSTATTEYRVFYQMNGHINSGALVRNGTPIAILPAGGTTPQNFQIFLNGAAAQSIKAAVTF